MSRFLQSLRLLIAFIFSAAAFSCNRSPAFTEKQLQDDPERFKEVKIGDQVWMEKNLNVVCFRNGDTIPEAKTEEEWQLAGSTKRPAWSYYDNNIENGKKYGKLYNWYAVTDPRGLAPEGWHVATYDDWMKLIITVEGPLSPSNENHVAKKLKSKTDWSENGCGTNETGFNALPGGCRSPRFVTLNGLGNWWCGGLPDPDSMYAPGGMLEDIVWGFRLIDNEVYMTNFTDERSSGNSVRCVRD
jgi:uncharacterized protein (TIGR02145 family)